MYRGENPLEDLVISTALYLERPVYLFLDGHGRLAMSLRGIFRWDLYASASCRTLVRHRILIRQPSQKRAKSGDGVYGDPESWIQRYAN